MKVGIQLSEQEIRQGDSDAIALMLGRARTPKRGLRQLMGNVDVSRQSGAIWYDRVEGLQGFCRLLRNRLPHFAFFADLQTDFYFYYLLAQSRSQTYVRAAVLAGEVDVNLGVFRHLVAKELQVFARFAAEEAEVVPSKAEARKADLLDYLSNKTRRTWSAEYLGGKGKCL